MAVMAIFHVNTLEMVKIESKKTNGLLSFDALD